MTTDRHTAKVGHDDGWFWMTVACPYDAADTSRPCWPYSEEGTPDPAPQDTCTYENWADNVLPEEILHGRWAVECALTVEWAGWDAPHFHLGDPVGPVPE